MQWKPELAAFGLLLVLAGCGTDVFAVGDNATILHYGP
jgi:hypothetical protein